MPNNWWGRLSAVAVGVVIGGAISQVGVVAEAAPPVSTQAQVDAVFAAQEEVLGLPGMQSQEQLNAFKTWLITRPGVYQAGYFDSAVDIGLKSMTLMWHGSSALEKAAVTEGRRRGLNVDVESVPYTRDQVLNAMSTLTNPASRARFAGFIVTTVEGPTPTDSEITVLGSYSTPGANRMLKALNVAPDVATQATRLAGGLSVRVQYAATGSYPYTTRTTDSSPFNAGGFIKGSDGYYCSSGFAIVLGGEDRTMTARHCTAGDYTAANKSTSNYGGVLKNENTTGSKVLTGAGYPWMFDGAYNDSNGYHEIVNALSDVSFGSSVCSSGGNSGVHCNLKVTNMNEEFADGAGSNFDSIRVTQQTKGAIAGASGDSGGPILIPNSDGKHVWAVGMLQGSQEDQLWGTGSCGGANLTSGLHCAVSIEFTSERVMLNRLGATLAAYS